MGDDLTALLDHVELGPVHLAGISDGGVVALDQAIRRPATVRTIAIIGANYCVDEHTLGAAQGFDVDAIDNMPDLRPPSLPVTTGATTRGIGRTWSARSSTTTATTLVVDARGPADHRLPGTPDRRRAGPIRQHRPDDDDAARDPKGGVVDRQPRQSPRAQRAPGDHPTPDARLLAAARRGLRELSRPRDRCRAR